MKDGLLNLRFYPCRSHQEKERIRERERVSEVDEPVAAVSWCAILPDPLHESPG